MNTSKLAFPFRLFSLAFVVSIVAALIGVTLSWQIHQRADEMAEKDVAITKNIGHIMLLDEALTMSAHMAVATGDMGYEQRYDQLDSQLTTAISEVRALLPQGEIANFISETEAANSALVKTERQAFALAHQGRAKDATALLASDEYSRLKGAYAGGMRKTIETVDALIESNNRKANYFLLFSVATSILSVLIFMLAWLIAFKSARSWLEERARNEEELADSKALIASVVENVPLMIFLKDATDLRFVLFNRAGEELLGYERKDLLGKNDFDLFPAAQAAYFMAKDRETLDGELSLLDIPEEPILTAGKEPRLLHTRKVSIRGSDGKSKYLLGISEDITARKRAEEALKESEKRYHELFDQANEGLLMMTENGHLSEVNQAFAAMHGYTADELRRMDIRDLDILEERTLEDRAEIVRRIQAGEVLRFEVEHRHKDGHIFPLSVTTSMIRLGGRMYYLAFHQDITERMRVEDVLRRSERSLNEAQRIAKIGNWELNLQDDTLTWSDEVFRIFEIDKSRFHANYDAFLNAIHPEDRDAVNAAYTRSLETRAPYDIAHRLLMPDGRIKYVHERCESVFSAEGKPIRSVGTVQDITERKQAEIARASLEAQLRESQKMEAIGTLAGGIAHDFNNALATILGNAELARQDMRANSAALESLEEIRKAGARARDLVQQILTFSRRQPTERRPMALATVIEESARLLRATLPARVTLEVSCATDVPIMLADVTQMQQILINLANNAMYAMRGGSGRIGIRLDTVTLDATLVGAHPELSALQAKCPGCAVRLEVSDNGAGMDAATLGRIFEPFFTTKPLGEGTGLGLSIVHGMVRAHEGAIVVDSQAGKGTTFTLYFPAADAQSGAPNLEQRAARAAPEMGGGQQILYIDDDESLVFLVQRLLERRGFRISGYTNQSEALAALRAEPHRFDLVVSDYNMPGMSGLEVAREVHAIRADLPVAVASGFIDEALRARADGAGVVELIFKADAAEDLCEALMRLAQTAGEKSKPSGSGSRR